MDKIPENTRPWFPLEETPSYATVAVAVGSNWVILAIFQFLKTLFNNVFTLNNLSCMALHAISGFGKV